VESEDSEVVVVRPSKGKGKAKVVVAENAEAGRRKVDEKEVDDLAEAYAKIGHAYLGLAEVMKKRAT
jgi:hypothetical protein